MPYQLGIYFSVSPGPAVLQKSTDLPQSGGGGVRCGQSGVDTGGCHDSCKNSLCAPDGGRLFGAVYQKEPVPVYHRRTGWCIQSKKRKGSMYFWSPRRQSPGYGWRDPAITLYRPDRKEGSGSGGACGRCTAVPEARECPAAVNTGSGGCRREHPFRQRSGCGGAVPPGLSFREYRKDRKRTLVFISGLSKRKSHRKDLCNRKQRKTVSLCHHGEARHQ